MSTEEGGEQPDWAGYDAVRMAAGRRQALYPLVAGAVLAAVLAVSDLAVLAVYAVLVGLFLAVSASRRFVELRRTELVDNGQLRRRVPWSSVTAVEDVRSLGARAVLVRTTAHQPFLLKVPRDGFLRRDPAFDDRLATIRGWARAHGAPLDADGPATPAGQ